jgi:hypothetical protein
VYITFKTKAEAKSVIEQKHKYTLRLGNHLFPLNPLEKYDIRISEMSNSLYSYYDKYAEGHCIGIIKPLSTLEVAEEIPSGQEYIEKLHSLIQMIARINPNSYQLEVDTNPITGTPDDRHVFVKLPSKDAADLLYKAQPLLGCLIVFKFTHPQFFSFMRYHPDLCMMCSSKKVIFI